MDIHTYIFEHEVEAVKKFRYMNRASSLTFDNSPPEINSPNFLTTSAYCTTIHAVYNVLFNVKAITIIIIVPESRLTPRNVPDILIP